MKKYLGIGPSANSYNQISRQWNISINSKYIELINQNENYFEYEILDNNTQYNDYVLTSLRTMWGIDLDFIYEKFGKDFYDNTVTLAKKYIKNSKMNKNNKKLFLTDEGKFISDSIITDFLVVE